MPRPSRPKLPAIVGLLAALLTSSLTVQAGDILRGGARGGVPGRTNSGSGITSAEAARARANAQDALARTSQALKSVQQMQAEARAAAQGRNNLGLNPNTPGKQLPNVPNGLVPGGLEVVPGVGVDPALWQGAQLPRSVTPNEVFIKQTAAQAILNWKTFNVGKETTVTFDQRLGGDQKGQWIAFNKISDPSGVPSQILGKIRADGQVYIINPNGIIFGGTSQVNTHALVASSLPINDNLITRGLLNNPDQQFLFSSLVLPAGSNGTPSFTPPASPAGVYGDVTVQAGAELAAPTTPEKVGGRVALIGTNVRNSGKISTPDGQTILAAGNQVAFAAHASSDPSLRGLDTFVGAVNVGAGTAINDGVISAPRGNTTIAGKDVKHLGAIESTTSVTLNGRIDLLAEYGAAPILDSTTQQLVLFPRNTGTATLGASSVTRILPEWSSEETATGTALALKSQVKVNGLAIHLAGNASILAPSGQVELNAGTWQTLGNKNVFTYDRGQVFLSSGAMVNVAGSTDIAVPVTQNILSVPLRGAELADSPLQRNSFLRGTTINVDLRKIVNYDGSSWIGTPLANASGYVGLIEKKVGQFTTGGGTIRVNAGESVILQPGSRLDVSGGYINFQGGTIQTTRLRAGGRLIDIADALPDRVYDGIYTGTITETHAKYGITRTFSQPLALTGKHFEPDYVQGGNGGTIAIQAPAMVLDGELLGRTVPGARQIRDTAKTSSLPVASSLALSFLSQTSVAPYSTVYSTPKIAFQNTVPDNPAAAFSLDDNGGPVPLNYGHRSVVILSPELLTNSGFGALSINSVDGSILVPEDVKLNTSAGGKIDFAAANISIRGQVTAPGGTLNFKTLNISPVDAELAAITKIPPPPNPDRGVFQLASGASLSTAGLIIDDRPASLVAGTVPVALNGGKVTISSYTANLETGSIIDVSGGALASADGKRSYGNGGSITIKTGQDPDSPGVLGGKLVLGSTLRGFSGAEGGALSVQAALMQVGGAALHPSSVVLQPSFFRTGGFSSYTITGLGAPGESIDQFFPAVYIAPETVIEPVAQGLVVAPQAGGALGLRVVDKPVGLRTPVSLRFATSGVTDSFTGELTVRGDIVMGAGSVIRTDPLANVTLSGQTAAVLGSIYAPGGSITISGSGNSGAIFTDKTQALTTVYISSQSVLSAAGTTLLTPDPYGRRLGSVLPGGSITVSGNIVAAAGTVLDVSGTSGILDLAPPSLNPREEFKIAATSGITQPLAKLRTVPTRVDSNAGSITLKGGTMLYSDATLLGAAGGPTALGGSLSISSGRFYPPVGAAPLPQDSTLLVSQSGASIFTPLPDSASAIGSPAALLGNPSLITRGNFSVDTFTRGGFDSLALNGVVEFAGPIDITARQALKIADGGILWADSPVHLTAPYVALGTAFQAPVPATERTSPFPVKLPPTFGTGELIVTAKLIDVGNLSLQNIGSASLIADGGDIRGNGTLNIAGDLTLRAAQIYPTTASNFTIVAYDHAGLPGSVTITGSGSRQLPLSAGGTLSIYASTINQGGVLRAPLGSINLGWDGTGAAPVDLLTGNAIPFPVTSQLVLQSGSTTSVSAIDPLTGTGALIPFGISLDGNSWISPFGTDITSGGLPSKSIRLAAANLTTEAGSLIDVRGGGDLYAYRWVQGNGGSTDILASTTSFAVVPGYAADYAAYAPFNSSTATTNLISGSGPGYTNSTLNVGDRIYLAGSNSLPAGYYTLLPARYALLPGAALVTPKTGSPTGTIELPEGASIVSGYRFNDLNTARTIPTIATRFEVANSSTLRARAQYDDFFANIFLKESAAKLGIAVPRLPTDSGSLVFQATQSMNLAGTVAAKSISGGRGSLVDISSPLAFVISGSGATAAPGQIVLDAATLNGFGAESLLIGGTRQQGSTGTTISVAASTVTVDNAGTPLVGPDIILVAKQELNLAPGAAIYQEGLASEENNTLLIGDAAVAGSGDGLLLRVSSDAGAQIIRSGVTTSTIPQMNIGAGVTLSGRSLTLDSTARTTLDPTTQLLGEFITLNSGKISLVLDNSVALQPDPGLVLAGTALAGLQAASSLSFTSYSTLDLYGAGEFRASGQLALHAAEIRGFTNGATVTFAASNITLDNRSNGTSQGSVIAPSGSLVFDAETVQLGAGAVKVDQFANLVFKTTGGVIASGTGSLATQGDLSITAPVITGAQAANYSITATGALTMQAPVPASTASVAGGLGATLSFTGASVSANTDILLPSGSLTLHATAGSVLVGNLAPTNLNVAGTAQTFYDATRYTNGGQISITSDTGSVVLDAASSLSVAAPPGGGNAGTISISAPTGTLTLAGTLAGQAGTGGLSGSFNLDVGSLASVTPINDILNAAEFSQARSFRVRTGNVSVDGLIKTRNFNLSADQGSITVNAAGVIDASGPTGGSITLSANGSVTLLAGSVLTVAGADFNAAGKGGDITLEAGSQRNGVVGTGSVDIQTGSTLNLSVASKIAGDASTAGSSAYLGKFSGKLHIRAPQFTNGANLDVRVEPINGTIVDASSIVVEGYRLFDLTNTGGLITNTGTTNAAGGLMTAAQNVQTSINVAGTNFIGTAGVANASYNAMITRLLGAGDPNGLLPNFVLAPGAEIINRTGDLTLGSAASTTTSDWNLATFRFGTKRAPGVLTMRAAGNVVFFNALNDGFTPTLANTNTTWLWTARLSAQNTLLPVNTQSWSYRLVAGADMTASNFGAVLPTASLAANKGFLRLGKNNGQNQLVVTNGQQSSDAQTSTAIANRFQVIRTGTGDIDIHTGRSVQLLNHFATIYTAGARLTPTQATLDGNFDTPVLPQGDTSGVPDLGSNQQVYPATYSMAGGNVSIFAQQNIEHLTRNALNVLVPDSQFQMPTNWLYDRGYVAADGTFATMNVAGIPTVASTTWWVDFSNFFQGIGALGGGNVTMIAGENVSNVDAVIPTNARMSKGIPNVANLVELGGGDLIVKAGADIDAGVYYVERGQGRLEAGGQIKTNATRELNATVTANATDSPTWMPTTLFVGKSGFDVNARGNVVMGPVSNPFFLPAGLNNNYIYKTYFSTLAQDSQVKITSLGGNVTLRTETSLGGNQTSSPILQEWYGNKLLWSASAPLRASYSRPWLRLNESSVQHFGTIASVLPPLFTTTAFSGDINLAGDLLLAPAPSGGLELLARGAINGLQPTGASSPRAWNYSTINVSDASPSVIRGITNPFSYQLVAAVEGQPSKTSTNNFLKFLDDSLLESGATTGSDAVLQVKQARHAAGLLHRNDLNPVRLYASGGDISGLTLFSPKAAQIFSSRDISDVAFYIQNLRVNDTSIVSSGRDIIPFNANSPLRVLATTGGNAPLLSGSSLAGDIQIAGQGTLEVLAGRNLDLGTGSNNSNGTGVGITSIGNGRNAALPFEGANVIVGAGIGPSAGLAKSELNFADFMTTFGADVTAKYLSELSTEGQTINLEELTSPQKEQLALQLFYPILRDAGRDYTRDPATAYAQGFAAIASLFPNPTQGDVLTRGRDIRTKSGGSISIFAPGGKLTLANTTIGNPLAPPGIITESGGAISIFTNGDVDLGIGRIFTLRGGSQIIWSSTGNIAAGSSPKTVQSAPPTRILIDPQSANVTTDLAGLATGGGIGVLATIDGVAPGSVDLIAPTGVVDAGDAGIQATGNLNIAAVKVLNADNIQAGGTSTGIPVTPTVATPNLSSLTAGSATAGATNAAANEVANQQRRTEEPSEVPSIITVEVLGYGGGDDSSVE